VVPDPTHEDMPTTELLARVPFFKGLDQDDLQRIAAVTRTETYAAGKEIVRIGDAGHSLYILLEGDVVVVYPARSADVQLARLGAGEFFGEMAILNQKPRSATVKAVGEVKVLRLERDDFTRTVIENPLVALKVMEALSVRIRNTDEQLSELSESALRDSLTGLLNRRSFHDRLAEETDRGRRYGDAFALVLLDIDHFKAINDTFGHQVGDTVLAWIGRLLGEHTRGADVPFRVGGEEFAVICPETGVDEASAAGRRLVELVSQARPPVSFALSITVSAGHAVCPVHGKRGDQVFHAADQALLKAKSDGRNRSYGAPLPVG
jgi:diguanylate cyclase (GGDEF)-like protein